MHIKFDEPLHGLYFQCFFCCISNKVPSFMCKTFSSTNSMTFSCKLEGFFNLNTKNISATTFRLLTMTCDFSRYSKEYYFVYCRKSKPCNDNNNKNNNKIEFFIKLKHFVNDFVQLL